LAGRNALGEEGNTADVIMQNFPVFFVDDAREMCEFTYAGVVAGDYPGYLARHPETAHILDAMAKVEGSVLTTTYWAILPFRCGAEHVVKYRLDPETAPDNVPNDAPDGRLRRIERPHGVPRRDPRRYRANLTAWYGLERRWSERPFWRRRSSRRRDEAEASGG